MKSDECIVETLVNLFFYSGCSRNAFEGWICTLCLLMPLFFLIMSMSMLADKMGNTVL